MTLSESEAVEKRVSPPSNLDDEIDLLEVARVLWAHRRLILATTVITTLAALIISFMLPKVYTADATILPTASNDMSSALAAGLSAQLGAAAGLLGGLGGLGGGKSADLVDILRSRSMAERVIAKCHLDLELKGWQTHGNLVDMVQKMTQVTAPSLKTKLIDIKVSAKRADLAATIANTYVSELKSMLDEIGYNRAAKNRKFIESQLSKTKEDLTKAEDSLSAFQSMNHLASLPEAVMTSMKAISDLEAQQIGASVQLKTTDEALGLVKLKVSALQADPSSLLEREMKKKSLATQEQALAKAKETFLDKLTSLPPKGMELARLQRDVQMQNAIYLALSQQYETAMISENQESGAFLPLDAAETPDHPSAPKKTKTTLMGFMAGILFGVIGAFVRNFFYQRKKEDAI